MNYLQLCQELVVELGLSGATGPPSVVGNTITELKNVARWIRDAALDIDNQFLDWKYLWQLYVQSGNPNATTLPASPTSVRMWDINKFRFRSTGVAGSLWQPMSYVTRANMMTLYDPDNAPPNSPQAFTINPDNSVMLSAPLDIGYDFRAEFWRRPVVLAADGDVPMIPVEYHRMILCRAAVMYGNREDAPEIINGLTAEYTVFLDKLKSDQLEGFALRSSSTDRERVDTEVSISEYLR